MTYFPLIFPLFCLSKRKKGNMKLDCVGERKGIQNMFEYQTCVFSRSKQKAGHREQLLPQICICVIFVEAIALCANSMLFPPFPALLFERGKEREHATCLCTSKKENMKQCLNMKHVCCLAQTREGTCLIERRLAQTRQDTCLTAFLEHVCGRLAQTREDTCLTKKRDTESHCLHSHMIV